MIDNRSKSKIDSWPYARRPVSGVQCTVPNVQCPMSGVQNWWLCNFFAGHRTSDNALEFSSVLGGGYFVTLVFFLTPERHKGMC